MRSKVLLLAFAACVLACSLAAPPTPTPEPLRQAQDTAMATMTATATVTPTPVVIVVTATPAPTPTVDLWADVVIAPATWWMDSEIDNRYPGADIWPPTGLERGVRLYRIFEREGQLYMAVFEQGAQKWEFADAVEIKSTPTPTPAATSGAPSPEREARRRG